MQNGKEQNPLSQRGLGIWGFIFFRLSLTDGFYCFLPFLLALSESVCSSRRAGCMQIKMHMLERINKLSRLK